MSTELKPALDLEAALARLDGDDEFLAELAELFLGSIDELLESLNAAVQTRRPEEISDVAHAIKGSLGNFCAHPAFDAALSLETTTRAGDLRQVDELHVTLVREIERLNAVLKSEVVNAGVVSE